MYVNSIWIICPSANYDISPSSTFSKCPGIVAFLVVKRPSHILSTSPVATGYQGPSHHPQISISSPPKNCQVAGIMPQRLEVVLPSQNMISAFMLPKDIPLKFRPQWYLGDGIHGNLMVPMPPTPKEIAWKAKCPIFKAIIAGFRSKVA